MRNLILPAEKPTIDNRIPQRRLSRHRAVRDDAPYREKKKYLFVGLSGGAGTTMLALSFAAFLSSRVSAHFDTSSAGSRTSDNALVGFVEISDDQRPPSGYTYDRVGMDKRFAGREYTSFYHLLSAGKSVRGAMNPDSGVNWALRLPGENTGHFDAADYIRLLDNTRGDSIICDVSGNFGNHYTNDDERIGILRSIAADANRIIAVVNPAPAALMADSAKYEMLKSLEASGASVLWLVNNMNRGVNKKELLRFLRTGKPCFLDTLEAEDIYASEYSCETVYERPRAAEKLRECFDGIALL